MCRYVHHVAYPSYGIGWPGESALRVRHADGVIATRLYVQDVEVRQEPDAMLTLVKLKDCVYPFYVNLCYKAYRDVDVIETWTEFSHSEKTPVTLLQFASSYLPLRRGDVWLSSLYGGWGNEARLLQETFKPASADKEYRWRTQFAYCSCRSNVFAGRETTGKHRAYYRRSPLLYR